MERLEIARRVFRHDRYATETTGIALTEVGEHCAVCTLGLDDRHRNARGAVMGGAMFTLADFAAAVACNSEEMTDGELHWVSLNASIHYLAPATGTALTARCTALKHGRTTALYQTTVADAGTGRTVGIVETTMVRVS